MVEIIRPHLDPVRSRVLIPAGWDDVPHLDAKAKAEMLAETPEWLRDARSKGTPSIGAGAIYPFKEEHIRIDPFPIPAHWPRAYALDVGWNWTAAVWKAWDLETLTAYLYAEYLGSQSSPSIHADAIKARGSWIAGVVDPSANNRQPKDGDRLMVQYQELGLELTKANNAVESGLVGVWQDMAAGRLKVFSTLQNFFAEFRLYRRDENGKIVKKKDHLMDCMRYLHNSGADVKRIKPEPITSLPVFEGDVGVGGY